MGRIIWLALGYQVPANPSKNRVYVWRKLKEFGAGYFKQGVAILPKSSQSMAQFRLLSAKIRELGGEANIAELKYCDTIDETQTIEWFKNKSESEYRELLRDCSGLLSYIRHSVTPQDDRPEKLKSMMRKVRKAKSRDYFKNDAREDLRSALFELAKDIGGLDKTISSIID